MKTIFLLLVVIVGIILEKVVAEYLLVEVDGADKKGTLNLFHSLLAVFGSRIISKKCTKYN